MVELFGGETHHRLTPEKSHAEVIGSPARDTRPSTAEDSHLSTFSRTLAT